jgi:hypothetical protein
MSAMNKIEDKIKAMTREQKYEELRSYLMSCGVSNLDIERIKADQAILGAPDSALDDALVRCAQAAGAMLGGEPATAQELVEALHRHQQTVQPRAQPSMVARFKTANE